MPNERLDTHDDLTPDIDKFLEIISAGWPDATAYEPGSRFRIRNRDLLGFPLPNDQRGRTGTVVTVVRPVVLSGGLRAMADVSCLDSVGLCDIVRLLGLKIEMIHAVSFDDAPGTIAQLSHTWMEPESLSPLPDTGWLDERAHYKGDQTHG